MVDDAKLRAETQTESTVQGTAAPAMRADDHSNASPAVETPVEGRQGFLGAPVLMVLVGGLVLAIIAWFVVEAIA
ncbi:hypothetical protein IP69_15915 [Bosea sp. AAP35]|uniref:hypothetical protein n=1 Tax=Bosea sp. AAP35 TaxID=1523417 RepID=UPI0006B8CDA0|nr:hypothetical protein [Bosea sp. AAP35]KPF65961.1 hypothetical protein IP69_15915 [Bosea sp. AAP35]